MKKILLFLLLSSCTNTVDTTKQESIYSNRELDSVKLIVVKSIIHQQVGLTDNCPSDTAIQLYIQLCNSLETSDTTIDRWLVRCVPR